VTSGDLITKGPYFDVRAYGAIGDGAADDTAAIQAAITASNGKGSVYFARGKTFLVTPPSNSTIFTLATNGTYAMTGGGTIKLKNSAGDFNSMFGTKHIALDSLELTDLTIDQNASGNPPSNTTSNAFSIAAVSSGDHFKIDGITVKNIKSRNTILSQVQNTTITNSRFYIDPVSATYHDHSTLYCDASNTVIAGNIFRSAINTPGVNTAIETHGSNTVVSNNVVEGYRTGEIIGGASIGNIVNVVSANNVFDKVYYGMDLYSLASVTNPTGYGLNGISILNNIINVTQRSYTVDTQSGTSPLNNMCGIKLHGTSDLPINDIAIKNNIIRFDLSEAGDTTATNAAGIDHNDTKAITLSNIDISGNHIVNAPAEGIHLYSGNLTAVNIRDNYILNAGSSLDAGLIPAYHAGVFLWGIGATKDIHTKNVISDLLDPSRMAYGIYGHLSDVGVYEDKINLSGSNTTSYVRIYNRDGSSTAPYVDIYQTTPAVSTSAQTTAATGSVLRDPANKYEYTSTGWKPLSQLTQGSSPTFLGATLSGTTNLIISNSTARIKMKSPDNTYWYCQPENTTGNFTCASN
jgi:polygalacturonase